MDKTPRRLTRALIEIESQSQIALALLFLLLAGAAPAARAQDDSPSSAELGRRLEALAAEVEDLRHGDVVDSLRSQHGFGPAASKVYGRERGLSIGGYGEMLYQDFGAERQDGATAGKSAVFDFLRLVLYTGYKFDDHVLFNAEIEFEHASPGEAGEVSVEFANLDFLVRREFNARAGILLVPMGYVNEMHEPPTFFGAQRPEVELRIVPTTWRANGAGVFGAATGSLQGLSYRAYLVESLVSVGESARFDADGLRSGRQSGSKAVAADLAGVLRLEYARSGVTAAGAVFFGNTAQGATVNAQAFGALTTVYAGHLQVRRRGATLRALVAAASVQDAAQINAANGFTGKQSVGSQLLGWYVEAGWDVLTALQPGSRYALVPYARYSELDTQWQVPSGYERDPEKDRSIATLGLAFYPHSQVVVKGDYEIQRNAARTGVDRWSVALGYLF